MNTQPLLLMHMSSDPVEMRQWANDLIGKKPPLDDWMTKNWVVTRHISMQVQAMTMEMNGQTHTAPVLFLLVEVAQTRA